MEPKEPVADRPIASRVELGNRFLQLCVRWHVLEDVQDVLCLASCVSRDLYESATLPYAIGAENLCSCASESFDIISNVVYRVY